jgi:hypothetical protein
VAWRFKEFLGRIKGLDEAGYLATYNFPILLSEGQGSASASGKLGGDEPTKKIGTVQELVSFTNESEDAWVLPLRRKETSSHGTIVTVGRGEDCDIRLSHPLVSKRHAYFTQDAEGWFLNDAASTNCTFCDGDRLEPHKPHRLADSIALRFGPAVKYRFFAARGFYAYCAMRLRMKSTDAARAVERNL